MSSALTFYCRVILCVITMTSVQHARAQSSPAIRVTAIQPAEKELLRTVEQPAQVQAYAVAPLHAKISGYVKKVHVEIGQAVKEGTVLLTIDCPELRAELKEKQALLKQADASIEQAESAVKVADAMKLTAAAQRAEWSAMADKAKAESQRYKSEFDRISKLADTNAVPNKVRDESESQFRAAMAMVAAMTAKQQSGDALIAEAQAKYAAAESDLRAARSKRDVVAAELEGVEAKLSFAELKAPFSGEISTRHVDPGHLVTPNSSKDEPLLTVVQAERLRLAIEVPEIEAGYLSAGDPAKIRFPALSNSIISAKVTRVAAAIHPSTRTLKAEVELDNADGKLKPGLFAHALITVAMREKCLTLPISAILTDASKNYCLAIQQGKIVRLPLELGLRAGSEVEVLSGVVKNEQIIPKNPANYTVGQEAVVIPAANK